MSQDKPSQGPHELRALHRRWAFLDLETTGLTEPIGVVQVGIEVVDFDDLGNPSVAARLSICTDPGLPHEVTALAVHGMAAEDLVAGRPAPLSLHGLTCPEPDSEPIDHIDPVVRAWPEAAREATAWLAALRPDGVACWGDYDFLVLEALAGRDAPTVELPPANAYLDLRTLYRERFAGTGADRTSTRLAKAAEAFGLGAPQAHRALADAELARRVFVAMADHAAVEAVYGAA